MPVKQFHFLIYYNSLLGSNQIVPNRKAIVYQCWKPLDQRSCLVLCRHHNGHPSHAGDVGGSYCGGGQWCRSGGDLQLRLAIGLGQHLGLRQLGVALRLGQRATIGARLRGDGWPTWQGAVVVVAVVDGSGGPMVPG